MCDLLTSECVYISSIADYARFESTQAKWKALRKGCLQSCMPLILSSCNVSFALSTARAPQLLLRFCDYVAFGCPMKACSEGFSR